MPLNREYALHMGKKKSHISGHKEARETLKDFECVSVRAQERERFMVMRINSKQNQAFFHYAQK